MPIYKDKVKRIWYVSCYYENWKGETEHKMKRGFRKKKEAQEWEHTFKLIAQRKICMTYELYPMIYVESIDARIKTVPVKWKRKQTYGTMS